MSRALRIVFMGTPEFAVPSLAVLIEKGYDVVGVITAPDRPKGRGQKLTVSPVKEYAMSQGLNILQPTNLKAPEFIEELKALKANLQCVVAFRMLPEMVWNMPEYGTFNLHGSLLPQYRGAAPINWAVINGEKETGVTTFFLKHEIDTGSVIFQEKEPIAEDDTAGSLYGRLMHIGAKLVGKTVEAIEKGEPKTYPQNEETEVKHAPKIFKENCEINWNQPASKIYNFIRGLSPYPGAWCLIEGTEFKIFETHIVEGKAKPGEVKSDQKTFIQIGTADGLVNVTQLQMQGKRRMEVQEFLRGNKI